MRRCIPVLSIVLLACLLVALVQRDAPEVGVDYRYFIPRLLDTYLHYRVNGFGIQWYTPSFGSGLPAYPNPQHIQFSLPQALTGAVNPWTALMVSMAAFALAGSAGLYLFLRRGLGLGWMASTLGALFWIGNGYYIEHMIVGHVTFQPFPLLSFIVLGLFLPRLPILGASAMIACVVGLTIHQGGFVQLALFALSLPAVLSVLRLIRASPLDWRRIAGIAAVAGILALLLSGSKLFAIFSLMRCFPREVADTYAHSYASGVAGIASQGLGAMLFVPLRVLAGLSPGGLKGDMRAWTASPHSLWETDISLPPALIVLLGSGLFLLRRPRDFRASVPAILSLGLGVWLIVDFTLAKGLLYHLLKPLPVLRSLHVNTRFAAAFILPCCVGGAWIADTWLRRIPPRAGYSVFFLLAVATLAAPLSYFALGKDAQDRIFDLRPSRETYHKIRHGSVFPVLAVSDVSDDETFMRNSTSLWHLYDPLFGYGLDAFHAATHCGPVLDTSDGFFNMTNPTGYVFPELNGAVPFQRFKIHERAALQAFTRRQQPGSWRVPFVQSLLTFLSAATFIGIAVGSGAAVWMRLRRRFRRTSA